MARGKEHTHVRNIFAEKKTAIDAAKAKLLEKKNVGHIMLCVEIVAKDARVHDLKSGEVHTFKKDQVLVYLTSSLCYACQHEGIDLATGHEFKMISHGIPYSYLMDSQRVN